MASTYTALSATAQVKIGAGKIKSIFVALAGGLVVK